MTQEYIVSAFLHVADRRQVKHSVLFARLGMLARTFAKYKSCEKILSVDMFYSWCATLEISPFYVMSTALMLYENQAGVVVRMELMPTADREGSADFQGPQPKES